MTEDFYDYFIDLPSNQIKLSKKICRIFLETKGMKFIGTGFFLRIPIDDEWFYCLVANEHLINEESINNNIIIHMIFDDCKKIKEIKLDRNTRYIRNFREEELDITIIEILASYNINKENFLEPELDLPMNYNLINIDIYILQPIEKNGFSGISYLIGKIKEIIKFEFTHLANTTEGSSGSPIFLRNSNKVIGIHKCGRRFENFGEFIYPAINIIKEEILKRINGKYLDGKYIYDDGKYYIGEFKNYIPNGKGIKYYKNGNILYDGDFVNGKFEGHGSYILNDNEYYIGQFKNGLKNGKGIEYYSNGDKYEGDFVNNKRVGNGNYIWKSGKYHIGQWKNNLRNGRGTEYYPNGNIAYDGNWVNNKFIE